MADQAKKAPAGWYPHPAMANTLRYWDGSSWTEQVAPASTAAVPAAPARAGRSGPGAGVIAVGVALGIVLVILGIWFVGSLVTADDEVDCATENLQRAQDGRPLLDCR